MNYVKKKPQVRNFTKLTSLLLIFLDETLQELLKQLVAIEEHKVDDTKWYERASREHEWTQKIHSTLEKQLFLQDSPLNVQESFSKKVYMVSLTLQL
jgi:hypothetical protein